mmetsp:Transcript_117179/g.309589  ORF Transcript_117179/g.309589 Transcript_117179/m.309589 type:complete len:366 (-) Transcript_117179:706-1803(-)
MCVCAPPRTDEGELRNGMKMTELATRRAASASTLHNLLLLRRLKPTAPPQQLFSSAIPLLPSRPEAGPLQAGERIEAALVPVHLGEEIPGVGASAAQALCAGPLQLFVRVEALAVEIADGVRVVLLRGHVRILLFEERKCTLDALPVGLHVRLAFPEVGPRAGVPRLDVLPAVGAAVPAPVVIAHVVEVADENATRLLGGVGAVVLSGGDAIAGPLLGQAVPHALVIGAVEALDGHGERVVPKIVAANEVAQPGVEAPATGVAVDGPSAGTIARIVGKPDPKIEASFGQRLGRRGLHFHADDALDPKLTRCRGDHLVVQIPQHSSKVTRVDTPPWVVNVPLRAVHVKCEHGDPGDRQVCAIGRLE